MQKIQKFQTGRLYAAPKSTKTYELIDRNGHILTFRGRNPKTGDSWKRRSPPLGRNPPPGRHALPRTEEGRSEDAYHQRNYHQTDGSLGCCLIH